MSSETYTYKGISGGKYIEGEIEALNQEEASFKLKEQKIIITNLIKTKKKKVAKEKGKRRVFLLEKESNSTRCNGIFQAICNYGKGWLAYFKCPNNVERSNRTSNNEGNN